MNANCEIEPLKVMLRDGAITFGDLVGKLGLIRVECSKCERAGWYSVRLLIQQYGRDSTILDWKDDLTADCPRRLKGDYSDQCGARCPDLAKVL
jgi:hypothetical protein